MATDNLFTDTRVLADSLLESSTIVIVSSSGETMRLAADLEEKFKATGGLTFSATWREGLVRPFGAILDIVEELAAWAKPHEPELLQRFGWSLVNLLYPWRKNEAALPVGELRAGLADLVLRNDQTLIHQFFQKRNVRPQILSYLVQFVIETTSAITAATSSPVLLRFENVQLADELSISALQLLNRYARMKPVPVRIVAIAEAAPDTEFDKLLNKPDLSAEWRVAHLNTSSQINPAERLLEELTAEQRTALEAATVFALPFNVSDWKSVLPDELQATAETSVDDLVSRGLLHRVGEDRLRITPGPLAFLSGKLDFEKQQALHAQVLQLEESEDAFAAAWHAEKANRSGELRRYCLQAMQRAWAVSAYDTALIFAEKALAAPADETEFSEDLLLAMLNYEAGRYTEAHEQLKAAVNNPPPKMDPRLVEYLLGYNAVFGLNDWQQGIDILNEVLKHYEAKGDERGMAYIRNTLAFAHFNSRNIGEAISLEELNIEQLKRADVPDSFLASILQLNLGRLYRTSGEFEHALKLISEGLFVKRSELSSHAVLLFYATLGNFQFSQKNYRGALDSFHHAFELMRNVQLDSVKDQALFAFSRGVPPLAPERMTRHDELLYYIHFHLGRTYKRLGLDSRADVYLGFIREQADLLGHDVYKAVEQNFASGDTTQIQDTEPVTDFAESVTEAIGNVRNLVDEWSGEALVDQVADRLKAGQVVAILQQREIGQGNRLTDSIVIYDPARRDLAETLKLEIGGSHILRATSALVLPEARNLFNDVTPLPLVQQRATLRPENRARYAALMPVRISAQVLSPEYDGLLFDIVERFAQKTGTGLVAVAPFHLWRRDLVMTPAQGLSAFLVSSIDSMVLGDRLLSKVHGSVGIENLQSFRPRISEEALVLRTGTDSANGGHILIRIKRRGGYATDELLKLHAGTKGIIDLCDGNLSVAEVVKRVGAQQPNVNDQNVCEFLRTLWRRGALCFDEPVVQESAAAAGH
ncbi:MAG TPA: carbamoyltransferase C-terminal domain-containing protein [Pyrinomonadaceae bacterium]|nr:carbamoyltransferase C-terminal domain-containing protein [Pyrinomonadaceae bacterium]